MRLQVIAILILTAVGFALRLRYLTTTHPFFDEYTTVLAARQILSYGWPLLPSGLFYEHGLLATYMIAPFTALFIDMPPAQWQAAHWGLMLARWPSTLVSTATIPLIYAIGQDINKRFIALFAAGLFALSPEGMVWGGRARMYALATVLVLLTVYWAYRGAVYPAPARYRWLAQAAFAAALLTQFGAMLLAPPLVMSMALIGWLSFREAQARSDKYGFVSRLWFWRKTVFLEGLALALALGLAIWVKRLGRPLGATALDDLAGLNVWAELSNTVTYQTAFYFTWDEAITFLARQFGPSHHLWLALTTVMGVLVGLVAWIFLVNREKLEIRNATDRPGFSLNYIPFINYAQLFLGLVFGLIIIEMVTLLEPFRRNPRYIVMYLPLFYLVAAQAIFNFRHLFRFSAGMPRQVLRFIPQPARSQTQTVIPITLVILFLIIGFNDLRIELVTPEPAYETAFAHVQTNWQPGDRLLTMNTPAAGLYLGQVDGFTVQHEFEQFLLDYPHAPVDRWLGVPWVGTAADFQSILDNSRRTWFVIDSIRQAVYFRGDWQAVVNSQLEPVLTKDNVLVYRTRPDRTLLSTQPKRLTHINLDNAIELVGYTLDDSSAREQPGSGSNRQLVITLFWQPLSPIPADYTNFLHLRNSEGVTVAQQDRQPLNGNYPTSHWRPGETVIDPIRLAIPENLPAGSYTLFTGLYQLKTLARLPVVNDTSGENAIPLEQVTLP